MKLKSRAITEEFIFRLVRKHNERIVDALRRALKILRQEPDGCSNEHIDEALQMLEQLRPLFKPWIHLKPKDQTNFNQDG